MQRHGQGIGPALPASPLFAIMDISRSATYPLPRERRGRGSGENQYTLLSRLPLSATGTHSAEGIPPGQNPLNAGPSNSGGIGTLGTFILCPHSGQSYAPGISRITTSSCGQCC